MTSNDPASSSIQSSALSSQSGSVCIVATSTEIVTSTETSTSTSTPFPQSSISYITESVTTTLTLASTTDTTTSTLSETTTSTVYATATSTSFLTETVTTTDDSSTVTEPTPAGFTPIETVFPTRAGREALERRASDCTLSSTATTTLTTFVTTTTTTTAPIPIITVRYTGTLTSTFTTQAPPATTTVTTTATFTDEKTLTTTTTTVTSTTTTTAKAYPTEYAACAAGNYLSSYSGGGIYPLFAASFQTLVTAGSATECCSKCFADATCFTSWYSNTDSSCLLHTGAGSNSQISCNPGQSSDAFTYSDPRNIVISNGRCGQWSLFD